MDAPDHAVLRPAQFPTPPTCPCSQPHPPAPVPNPTHLPLFPTPPTCPCSQPHPPVSVPNPIHLVPFHPEAQQCFCSNTLKDLSMDAPDDAVEDCTSFNYPTTLKDPSMDAPDDAVEECISANNSGGLKEMDMDAPDDAVLRLAHLALSCTAERTASRPNMSYVASELQGIRHEVVGKEELSAAVKVDELAKERRIGMSLRKSLGAELEAIVSMDEEESNEEQAGRQV
ncbi:unnamed protein product [Closterium sp. Naga37s-1]|nr:unnamed protein product [Closterium sp. Naga37s-1]